jgi:hypothetical protein
MIDSFITFALCWLLIGSVLWILRDPYRHINLVQVAYLRCGRPATVGQIGLQILIAIVLWPTGIQVIWVGSRA